MEHENPHLIDLDQPLPGYRKFLSCWLWRADDLTFIVDPGPMSTIGHLIAELEARGVTCLDYVLVTHIHLDHSGGAAEVLAAFPDARLVCHESGVAHLVSPDKLWAGSQRVLGKVAPVYGKPAPVPAERLASFAEVLARGIKVIPTPGHAPHHMSFVFGDVLFAGEVAGTRCPLPDGRRYLRPATPPRFFLDDALSSIDRLLALDPMPTRFAFAHYGMDGDPRGWLLAAREQLVRWVDTIRSLIAQSRDGLEQRLFDTLVSIDPLYGSWPALDGDIQQRERHFLRNTLDGMLGYIDAARKLEDRGNP
ncbi:MAG: MBL fold metallo-hydrolase [Deltaproteobacteria bacterium]|nr:MBL fold metallo-hydrolase [Deltaproteobacteria bacterium]